MMNGLFIGSLAESDIESAQQLFKISIPDAFEKEGLGYLTEDIDKEIEHKKHMIEDSLSQEKSDTHFLIAKLEERIVGAISFGPCGEDIKKCTANELADIGELGSLFVLPTYQEKGVGSALIHAMVEHLYKQGIDQFCLDSGYKGAQKRWLRKFGEPYKIVKDYWGTGYDHMIWLCKVADFK